MSFNISNPLLVYLLIGCGIILNFQNCGKPDKKFYHNINDPKANVAIVNVQLTDHPIGTASDYKQINFIPSLADRNYIFSLLSEVFGPDSLEILKAYILQKRDEFGGPCSVYAHLKYFDGLKWMDQNPDLICDEEKSLKALVPPMQVTREGWIIQACSALVGGSVANSTFNYILGQIQLGAHAQNLPILNNENIKNLHRLFFRAKPSATEAMIEAIKVMFSSQSSTIEGWQMAVYSYCVAPQWQIL